MNPSVKITIVASATIIAGAAAALVVRLALEERSDPTRCPEPLVALGARCCGFGQTLVNGRCTGLPRACAGGMRIVGGSNPGCSIEARRIDYSGGTLKFGAFDWENEGVSPPQEIHTGPFALDVAEVTVDRFQPCSDAGRCSAVTEREPGRPITGVSGEEAARYCAFAGGRLPTGDEWMIAAAGLSARRFPWGATGLACRRAAYGLADGPCARGALGPEITGSRPEGATPEGALDLVGNVAEWTLEKDGRYVARGGSFQTKVAADLLTWSAEERTRAAVDVGFRCAYDRAPAAAEPQGTASAVPR